jgi:hypothetical protein
MGGELVPTEGALEEGIVEAGWYRRDQLQNEVVYPATLMDYNWNALFQDMWEAKYLPLRMADF